MRRRKAAFREQLAEAAQVNQTVRQYLLELEQQNPQRTAGARAETGVEHRSRCDLRDQGWDSGPAGVLRLFAELKNQIGLRRLRLRRLKFVREQFFLAATAQNIKRLVRFLSQGPQPPLPATT